MTDEEWKSINEIYKKEFPDEMPFDKVSAKLDTMNNHPYLDWFEKDKRFKGKKVYGIICLNSPTQQLIDKVHADKRMRLFEYQISYTEL